MDSPEKLAVFRERLQTCPSLLGLGFRHTGTEFIPATKLVAEGYKLRFSNHRARAITLHLFALTEQELVSVKILNTATDDSFALADWLVKKGAFDSYAVFWLTTYQGSFEQRVLGFLGYLAGVLESTNLASVLDGDTWEPIPPDWGGMR